MSIEEDEPRPPAGLVPVDARGSIPFALLHGDPLVTVASAALGRAGVELLDFTTSWADVQARETALVIHDPLCPGTPVAFVVEVVAAALERGCVVVGVRPVTDTVKATDGDVVGETVDRSGLLAVTSPVVIPPAVVALLPDSPGTDDLAELVTVLRADHEVEFVEAPPAGRRVTDESDLRLVESLLGAVE
jgi:2-C-methyl-D-erythritol 4-phosphate cytidylyltransferase